MKSLTGIWIDSKEARFITYSDNEGELKIIKSNIRSNKFKGGSRSKTPWGPMLKLSESKFQAKKEAAFIKYFDEVINKLPSSNFYEIYGPGQVKLHFLKQLEKENPQLAEKVQVIENLDSVTDNQFSAKVRERASLYFEQYS